MKIFKQSNILKIQIFLCVTLFISFILGLSLSGKLISKDSLNFVGERPSQNLIFKSFVTLYGEINNPGIYEFNEGEVLGDVITRAGGLTPNADSSLINLSRALSASDEIYIKSFNEASSDSSLLNINTASQSELEELPGIGPATAQAIIDARPYANIEDLLDVKGIGEKKFSDIKDLITL